MQTRRFNLIVSHRWSSNVSFLFEEKKKRSRQLYRGRLIADYELIRVTSKQATRIVGVENNLEKYLKKIVRDRSISARIRVLPPLSLPRVGCNSWITAFRAGAFHALAFDTCNTRVVVGTFVFEKSHGGGGDRNGLIIANFESLPSRNVLGHLVARFDKIIIPVFSISQLAISCPIISAFDTG